MNSKDMTSKFQGFPVKAKAFFEESIAELKKVSWPPKKEAVRASYAVVIFVVILSFFLGIVDYILAKLVNVVVG